MENIMKISVWSIGWPPEFEKLNRVLLAIVRGMCGVGGAVWRVLMVAPPAQVQIDEARTKAMQLRGAF